LRRVGNVSLVYDVTIPGLSEVIVDVYTEKDPVDELCSNLECLIEPSQSYMEKNPLAMAASLVDMMKNVTVRMRILNSSRTDVTVCHGTVIGTAVSVKVVRHVPFDRGKYLTIATKKQNTTGTLVLDVTRNTPAQRPEPKPNINKGTSIEPTIATPHLNVNHIYNLE
jgi:hypothetical protein